MRLVSQTIYFNSKKQTTWFSLDNKAFEANDTESIWESALGFSPLAFQKDLMIKVPAVLREKWLEILAFFYIGLCFFFFKSLVSVEKYFNNFDFCPDHDWHFQDTTDQTSLSCPEPSFRPAEPKYRSGKVPEVTEWLPGCQEKCISTIFLYLWRWATVHLGQFRPWMCAGAHD